MRCVATGKELPEGSEAVVIQSVRMGAFGPRKDEHAALLGVIAPEFWDKLKPFIDEPSELEAIGSAKFLAARREAEELRRKVEHLEAELEAAKASKSDLPDGASFNKDALPGEKTPVEGVDIPSIHPLTQPPPDSGGEATDSGAMEKIQRANRPFLDRLSPGLVNNLIDLAEVVDYPHGRIILEDGQVGQALYIIVTGFVEVLKRGKDGKETVIVILTKGQIFGEMSVLTGEPTSAAIRARGSARIMVLLKSHIDKLLMNNIEINRAFFSLLADRLRLTNINLTKVSSSDLRGRLSMFGLVDLVQSLFQSQRSGTLSVQSPGKQNIRIGFKDGQVQGVIYSDGATGPTAFVRALQWADGSFAFDDSQVEQQGNPGMDTMSFLMDTLRMVDEADRKKR